MHACMHACFYATHTCTTTTTPPFKTRFFGVFFACACVRGRAGGWTGGPMSVNPMCNTVRVRACAGRSSVCKII